MTVAPQAVCQRPGCCEEQILAVFTDLPREEEIRNPLWNQVTCSGGTKRERNIMRIRAKGLPGLRIIVLGLILFEGVDSVVRN
jgi:hypothetical protein